MKIRVSAILACLLAATAASAQRLPAEVVPQHYDIAVDPDLEAAAFRGVVTIAVRLASPATTIVLNAAELTIGSARVSAAGVAQPATVSLDPAREQVRLTVPQPIPAGAAEIHLEYRGILNDQLRGFYLSTANGRRYAVTQLEATDARRMFPSFDEPALKATFALRVTLNAGDRAVSNGAVISDRPGPRPGTHTVAFDRTPKMSTYLVALAVGDFTCSEGAQDGIPIRICSTPDKVHLTAFALDATKAILSYFNRYYSIPYPFKKLDVVAVPDFSAGAMENTGAIFYREEMLLIDPKTSSLGNQQFVAAVLGHEIAHQWFGDLVTMAWWDDLWLNEGFATWMATKPVAAWKPEWTLPLADVQASQRAMNLDALRSTRAVRAAASTPAEISELFDGIAYEKGAAILRMIEAWIGEDAFRGGINAYLERFKYANARAEDFWSVVAKSSGRPVDRVMASFVNQPGLPLVNVEIVCGPQGAQLAVSQERYVRDAAVPPSPGPSTETWAIPVCVRSAEGRTTCEVVASTAATIALPGCTTWVMPNAGARGYYRAAYPAAMLRRLAPDVAALSPAERMALLSDEWALVRAGRHDVGAHLDLASGFSGERTPEVLTTLTDPLRTIEESLTTAATRGPYRAWVGRLLAPALADVGWTAAPGEPDARRALRAAVIAAMGDVARDEAVLMEARRVVERELARPGTTDPTLLNVVVPLATLHGDGALYDRYLARAKRSGDPAVQYLFLNALTSFSDPLLVSRTLDHILGPEVRSQDAKIFIAGLLTNPNVNSLAWQLLKARWAEVQKKTGEFVGNTVIVSALSAFCDAKSLEDIRAFFAAHAVPDAVRTLEQSLERIAGCVRLAAAQQPRLAEWLASQPR